MRRIKKVTGPIKPCLRNDGSGVCFGESYTGCKNWHGQVTKDHGKTVFFRCDHGQTREAPHQRRGREAAEKNQK